MVLEIVRRCIAIAFAVILVNIVDARTPGLLTELVAAFKLGDPVTCLAVFPIVSSDIFSAVLRAFHITQ